MRNEKHSFPPFLLLRHSAFIRLTSFFFFFNHFI